MSDGNVSNEAAFRERITQLEARLEILSAAAHAFGAATSDYDRLLRTIAERMAAVLGDVCAVHLLSADDTVLRPVAFHAIDPAVRMRPPLAATPLRVVDHAMYRAVLDTGAPALVPAIEPAASEAPAPDAAELPIRCALVVALRAHGRSIGTVSIGRGRPGRSPFDECDRDFAQALANHAALAVDNARMLRSVADDEQRLAITLQCLGEAVITTDAHGLVERMNRVAENLTGWSLEEVRGHPLAAFFRIHDESTGRPLPPPVHRILREAPASGVTTRSALVSRDGTVRPIIDTAAPIRDAEGRTRGVVLVFRDRSADRGALELAAENRRVQEASRLKSEFLANMSHELRTPLNAIIGFGELLHDEEVGPVDDRQKEFLGHILTSARHLLALINDVLDLSKIEAGKLELRPEPIDASAVLDEVSAILRTTAAARGVTLSTRKDARLGEVVVDPARLKQVLYNYLSNALKFTPPGGTVEARILEDGPEAFRVEVEDTGIGIEEKDLERLFVEFQQLDAGTAKKHAGTGLGLALTRRLVEAQGGRVGVVSTPGRGSTFHATLPRHPPRRRPTVHPIVMRASHRRDRGEGTILVIADDVRARQAVAETLQREGFHVDTAAGAVDAIGRCNDRRYDGLALDIELLPVASGLDLLRAVRSSARNRDLKAVAVTTMTEGNAIAGFAVDDILGRPVEPAALVRALRRFGGTPAQGRTVWFVDDDPVLLDLVVATLGPLGFQSVGLPSAASALDRLERELPFAIVLDLLTPELGGFELLERIGRLEAYRSLPVIVWSGSDVTTERYERLRATARRAIARGGTTVGGMFRALLSREQETRHG